MQNFIRLFHTVKHLKFCQIYYRLYYRIINSRPVLSEKVQARAWTKNWSSPAWQKSSLNFPWSFTFLNEEGEVKTLSDWNSTSKSKLWLYNLHYLDELNSIGSEERAQIHSELVDKWIQEYPPYSGNGWEPYALSLRIVNLVKFFSRCNTHNSYWISSLALQSLALSRKLEYHILANHLFANAKALVFAGTYLGGNLGDSLLKKGLQLLDTEIKEQFLADGAHYELSPMYHSTLLWDICDLINLAHVSGVKDLVERTSEWKTILSRGLAWLVKMKHPDGEISFFNDASLDIAPGFDVLEFYGQKLGCKISNHVVTAESGYLSLDIPCQGKLIVDVGEVGPAYQPGHAHADTLSFELSLFGQRVFVNSGTSQYGLGKDREWERSTAAHNTLSIDSLNSSDVWAGFRVGKRARPFDLKYKFNEQEKVIQCSHDGYRPVIHSRAWRLSDDKLVIDDQISRSVSLAEAYFYLHPAMTVKQESENQFILATDNGNRIQMTISGASQVFIEEAQWHPAFGVSKKNFRIRAVIQDQELKTQILW